VLEPAVAAHVVASTGDNIASVRRREGKRGSDGTRTRAFTPVIRLSKRPSTP
jgi:hypothetical protein